MASTDIEEKEDRNIKKNAKVNNSILNQNINHVLLLLKSRRETKYSNILPIKDKISNGSLLIIVEV